jgi:hypothetical protein
VLDTVTAKHNDAIVAAARWSHSRDTVIEICELRSALHHLLDELQLFLLETESEVSTSTGDARCLRQYVLEDGLALIGMYHTKDV